MAKPKSVFNRNQRENRNVKDVQLTVFAEKTIEKIVYFTFGTFYDRAQRSADSVQVGVFHLGQT
jgi:hypothetical protein